LPVRPESIMTVARTVADVLTEHVVFEVECIDRMYLNVYQPKLQYATGIIGYLRERLDMPIAWDFLFGISVESRRDGRVRKKRRWRRAINRSVVGWFQSGDSTRSLTVFEASATAAQRR